MKRIFLIILLGFTVSVQAQEMLTFQQAVRTALEQNHQIKVAMNNAEIANNNVNIGNAGMLPKLDLVSTAIYQGSENDGNISNTSTTTAAAQASYTLFDGFGNVFRFQKLKAQGRAGELSSRYQIENTLNRVSSAYYNNALAQENRDIAQELLTISRQRLDRSLKKAEYGQANTIEVLSARVDFNADSVDALKAQLSLNETRRNLNMLLNRKVDDVYDVESVVEFIPDLNYEELKERSLSNNAAYLLEVNQLEQNKLDVKMAYAVSMPQVALTGSYGLNQVEMGKTNFKLDDAAESMRIGATVSLNLFNGFQTSIDRQNAKLTYQNQQLYEQEAMLVLETEIANAWDAYQNSKSVLELEQRNLEAVELNFKRTEELFTLGQVTTTQFREAQLNLVRARYSISSAKFSAKLQEIELLRISGNLVGNEKL